MAVAGHKVTLALSAQTTAKLQASLPPLKPRADFGVTGDRPLDGSNAVSAPGRRNARH